MLISCAYHVNVSGDRINWEEVLHMCPRCKIQNNDFGRLENSLLLSYPCDMSIYFFYKISISVVRGDVKIPHSRMTKTCWETLVNYL